MGYCSNRDQINTPHSGAGNLNLEDILDTITIAWANNCIVTSSRLYYEGLTSPEINIIHEYVYLLVVRNIFKLQIVPH